MILSRGELEGVRQGTISCAFRRWRRPTVKAGGTLRTAVGVLAIDAVDVVDEDQLTSEDAAAAGFVGLTALTGALATGSAGTVYRIRLHWHGPDPREALRGRNDISAADAATLGRQLARLDKRSPYGPWTALVLKAIAATPGEAAGDLAARLGYEKMWLKGRIRGLKELGLTESLEVGYRLSPRGRAVLPTL